MPNRPAAGQTSFTQALRLVAGTLEVALGFPPTRLPLGTIKATYPRRPFCDGWRIPIGCSDGETREVDILLSPAFPAAYPRTALVDRSDDRDWPHLEHDGVMCLLAVHAEVDPDRPGDVAVNLLAKSARLIEELLDGTIVERDFREEFLTYWFYASDPEAKRVTSLVRPGGPSRALALWRDRDGSTVVAEDPAQLAHWLTNLKGAPRGKAWHTEPAALVWLDEAPVPMEYPMVGTDLLALAGPPDSEAAAALAALASGTTDDAVVLIGAQGRGGPGLVCATTTVAHRRRGDRAGLESPLTKGFRAAPLPAQVASSRMFSAAPVLKSVVERADAPWVHGRGADARVTRLLDSTATVIGCGSLGSSVAARLARAGIGHLHLVDRERLAWSNVGRHELGADAVGSNKASALADRLRRELPHLTTEAFPVDARVMLANDADVLAASDLVICVTGSWGAESALNRWHVATGQGQPFLYGWLEDHALAAHAVVVTGAGNCLSCGFGPTGVPNFSAIGWSGGRPVHEEPACGNHFQPYGAVELGFGVDLVATTALDALLGTAEMPIERLWLAQARHVEAAGAEWSQNLIDRALGVSPEGGLASVPWPTGCAVCRAGAEGAV